ncbi:MAG: filamentous hemagglutinin N-terminal domain-containing protein, partial [Cyanobacteria bacterium J06576_12]
MFKSLLPVSFAASITASAIAIPSATAQITPALDGTGTNINRAGQQFQIEGGSLSDDGQNLFHSFEQFGLTSGQVADFFAQPNVQNVLGRVVGGEASVINGTLQVSGSAANLYLMNPAGVVFGNDAQLNVPGDFTATTATGIEFGAGQWFNAVGPNSYGQLMGSPTGFHLGSGSIVNSGDLAVGLGRQLNLVSNSVANVGSLTAPEGHILITALPGEDLLRLKFPGYSLGLELDLIDAPVSVPTAWTLPVAALSDLLQLDVVRANEAIAGIPDVPGTALVSGQVDVSGEQGGTVGILGDRVGLLNAQISADGALGGGQVLIGGEYQGQGTTPTATRTIVDGESVIGASAINAGNGGEVIVWADETTQFQGSINATGGLSLGNGGFVEVSGKESLFYRGNVDASAVFGEVGTVLLDPDNIIIASGSGQPNDADIADSSILFGDGAVGSTFTISEDSLELLSGDADLVLQANNDIIVQNLADDQLTFQPGSAVTQGGTRSIAFSAGNRFVMDEGDLLHGVSRNITITAPVIQAGSIRTEGLLGPGSITLNADTSISVGALRSASSDGTPLFTGNGGDISIVSGGTLTIDASESVSTILDVEGVAAFSADGNSGNITLRAADDIDITCTGSACLMAFAGGLLGVDIRGNGGDISIVSDTGTVSIQDTESNLASFLVNAN